MESISIFAKTKYENLMEQCSSNGSQKVRRFSLTISPMISYIYKKAYTIATCQSINYVIKPKINVLKNLKYNLTFNM